MVAWAVELTKFDIKFESRTAIKEQVLANFVTEMADDVSSSVVKT